MLSVHVFGGRIGESIVIELPNGEWGVVDNYTPNLNEPESSPTIRFLNEAHVQRLKFLCITHPHRDHYRGCSYILDRYRPDHVWIFGATTHKVLVARVLRHLADSSNSQNPETENADEIERIFDRIQEAHSDTNRIPRLDIRILQLQQPLLELPTNPAIKFTALGASGGQAIAYQQSLEACFTATNEFLRARVPSINHNLISGGILIEYGESRIILGGDIEVEAWEETMRQLPRRLQSNLVKVSHHGSRNGFCSDLWRTFSPARQCVAVVTPYTSQGLPSEVGLSEIGQNAARIYSASLRAMIRDRFDSTAFRGVSAEAIATLRAVFPTARRSTVRMDGRCSFTLQGDGRLIAELHGDAGLFSAGTENLTSEASP